MVGETHALLDDWIAHITYFPAFLFGFALARSEAAMAAIGRWWPLAAGLALLGYGFIAAVELGWPATPTPRWVYGYYGAAHATQQWAGIVALIGIAERWWNRDHRWRPMLTEAIFPFYMIHLTVIVLMMWALLPAGLPAATEFAILVASTVAGCWLLRSPSSSSHSLAVSTSEWMPSDSMAELPVNQAATNLIAAIPKLAASAMMMAVLD